MSFDQEYEDLKIDSNRKKAFISSSREKGRRTCSVFNTNIKTLGTFVKYIDEIYDVNLYPSDTARIQSIHQKTSIVREFNFRSVDNHDDITAIIRSDIVRKAYSVFGDYDNAFVIITLYILLLGDNENQSVLQEVLKFWRFVPKRIRKNINRYQHKIFNNRDYDANNFYQNFVMLYGDERLFQCYLDALYIKEFNEEEINEVIVNEYNNKNTPIGRRLKNLQKSSFKKEASYLFLYYCIKEACIDVKFKYLYDCKELEEGITFYYNVLATIDSQPELYWDYFGVINQEQSLEEYYNFLLDLTILEKEELIYCFANTFNIEIKKT